MLTFPRGEQSWGHEPDTDPKTLSFAEWLCVMVRVAAVVFRRESAADSVKAMAV